MSDISQFGASFWILSVMGLASLLFSLFFYLRFHLLEKLSKEAYISVFDKTFNVISLNPERRRVTHNVVILLIFAFLFPFLLAVGILEAIQYVSSSILFLLCLGLLMIDDAFEIYEAAGIFTKGFRNKVPLGQGDLTTLAFLKMVIPKLSTYYLFLAVIFFASSPVVLPCISTALLVLSHFAQAATGPTAIGVTGIFIGPLLIALITVAILFVGRLVKRRIFDFPPSIPLTAIDEQFERLVIMSKWAEWPPFELSHRPVLEDPETEERKRKALISRE